MRPRRFPGPAADGRRSCIRSVNHDARTKIARKASHRPRSRSVCTASTVFSAPITGSSAVKSAFMADPNGAVSCSPSYVTAESRSTMKAASDQPVRPTSVRPANHGRSSGRRSSGSAATAHSGQSTQCRGSHSSEHPSQVCCSTTRRPRGRPAEPAEVDLEQFRVAQPRDAAEEHHAEQGEDGIAAEQRGDRVGAVRSGRISSAHTAPIRSVAGQRPSAAG